MSDGRRPAIWDVFARCQGTVRYNRLVPYLQASEVKPAKRKVAHTAMGWEVNAESFYRIIKRFWKYGAVKNIIITENGAAYKDEV